MAPSPGNELFLLVYAAHDELGGRRRKSRRSGGLLRWKIWNSESAAASTAVALRKKMDNKEENQGFRWNLRCGAAEKEASDLFPPRSRISAGERTEAALVLKG